MLIAIPGGQAAGIATLTAASTYWAAGSAAAATLTLDTGSGRKFQRHLAKEVFDDALGMSPRVASFISGMISQTLLSSAYYVGATTAFPKSGSETDFTQKANQERLLQQGKSTKQVGGGSATDIYNSPSAKGSFFEKGLIESAPAFESTPVAGDAMKTLGIRHVAFAGDIGGRISDSSQISLWIPEKGVVWGSPLTATCHQAAFNTMIEAGASGLEAAGRTFSNGGWSVGLSSSIYGINGKYGLSGIYAGTKAK